MRRPPPLPAAPPKPDLIRPISIIVQILIAVAIACAGVAGAWAAVRWSAGKVAELIW